VNSSDWRSTGSVLRWCHATLIAVAGQGLTGCHWVSAGDRTTVEIPQGQPPISTGPDLDLMACQHYCQQLAVGYSAESNPVSSCHLATFAATGPPRPAQGGEVPEPANGSTVILCDYHFAGHFKREWFGSFGRRWMDTPPFRGSARSAREHFHRAAYCEAASIAAFEQLVFDLETLGASADLVRAAERAADDEAIHAGLSLAFARRLDDSPLPAWPPLPRASRRAVSAVDVAIENARGGCVNEMFGTWLQLFQAAWAPERRWRRAARRIARDEARHAALAFRIHDWLDQELSAAERRRVKAALLEATRRLADDAELAPALSSHIGFPRRSEMARARDAIRGALFPAQGS
jgi:hypothetical protein